MGKGEAGILTDEHLLRLVAEGSVEAFGILYDRYAAVAYGLMLRILGDPHEAEDALQEAMGQIWQQARRFDASRGSVRTWILAICRHRAVDRRRRRREQPVAEWQEEAHETGASLDEQVLERDLRRRVARALADLPAEQRRAVALAYFGGFSQREIAEVLQCPLGTVKGRLRLALDRLRRALAEGEGGGEGR